MGGSSVACTVLMLAIIQGLYILREDEDEEIERYRRKERRRELKKRQKRKAREISEKRRPRNREYTLVSCFFVLIFVSMIGYLIYLIMQRAMILSIVPIIQGRILFQTGL